MYKPRYKGFDYEATNHPNLPPKPVAAPVEDIFMVEDLGEGDGCPVGEPGDEGPPGQPVEEAEPAKEEEWTHAGGGYYDNTVTGERRFGRPEED